MKTPYAEFERSTDEDITLATNHVDWFLTLIRPLLISHFVHGVKHGREQIDKETC